jgi:hypothetical protein
MLVAIVLSNGGKVDCNESADYYRKMDMNFILLEKRTLNHGREVNFRIKNSLNNKSEVYKEENIWFAWHYEDCEVGETIIKK